MKKIVLIILVILLAVFGFLMLWASKKNNPVACTMEAKLCQDGTAVGRTGPNCEFAQCPKIKTDETTGWETKANADYNFVFKYPKDFFGANQEPKILVEDCNYNIFPKDCPSIDNMILGESVKNGDDIKAIKDNLASPNYWNNPSGEKIIINNIPFCLYQTADAGMGHVYNSYYYVTVKNQKCLAVNFITATTNCDFYLPIEKGNIQQQKNYNDCLITNQNQPKILNQILSTFEFTNN